MVGESTKKPWHKSDFLGHMDKEREHASRFHDSESVIMRAVTCSIFTEPPRPASSKPHSMCCGLAREKLRWRRSWTVTDLQKFLRNGETWLQTSNSLGDRYFQGYEDDLDVLVNALKKSVKNDEDRPHLCRAIWRRKRARTPPCGQTAEAGMLRGEASTSHQAQVATSQFGSASSGTWKSRKLSLISAAPSLSFQPRCKVRHYDRPRTNIENGGLICGTRALQTLCFPV